MVQTKVIIDSDLGLNCFGGDAGGFVRECKYDYINCFLNTYLIAEMRQLIVGISLLSAKKNVLLPENIKL